MHGRASPASGRPSAKMRLWEELRELRRQGYHFRRQAPIEPYIVDFACFSQQLIIEVDGVQHDTARMECRCGT
ncbi:MAG TPA: DUF559 domain-containing protein [Hyphomicrobiaceae bacterium]|nr:DUF559 domain-containing protein [Hyphomicrobiaceae bacterium]